MNFSEEVEEDWDEWLSDSVPEVKPEPTQNSKKSNEKREIRRKQVIPKEILEKKHSTRKRLPIEGDPKKPLTARQERFCQLFVKSNNATQAAIEAGYPEASATVEASKALRKTNVALRVKELRDAMAAPSIATGAEVMQFFTNVMQGKTKDQFGLEVSIADRTRAAIELAKRTVDLDQRLEGKADSVVEIKLDWKRE